MRGSYDFSQSICIGRIDICLYDDLIRIEPFCYDLRCFKCVQLFLYDSCVVCCEQNKTSLEVISKIWE